MDSEPKTAAEMKEIRIKRREAQDAEGIKAMADIAAADIAIRKRTEDLRAMRLAKEAADAAKPPAPAKIKAKGTTKITAKITAKAKTKPVSKAKKSES